MPIGTRHEETGWLNDDLALERRLRRDGGGAWRLEFGLFAGWRSNRLVGRRVRIVGSRIGFDVLSVDSIVACGPEESVILRS